MIKEINLSQLLALIAVSGSVKQIKMRDGDLVWRSMENVDVQTNSHTISLWWKKGEYCGSDTQYICMKMDELRKPYAWESHADNRFYEPILHAYYYQGDNCNRRTRFIYEIIGNQIDIIDDIGLVGNAGEYERKNLLKIDPNQIYRMKVRDEGRWSPTGKEDSHAK